MALTLVEMWCAAMAGLAYTCQTCGGRFRTTETSRAGLFGLCVHDGEERLPALPVRVGLQVSLTYARHDRAEAP